MARIANRSMNATHITVRVGMGTYHVPRSGDLRRWVTYNVPEALWDRVMKAVEYEERWSSRVDDEEPDTEPDDDDSDSDDDDDDFEWDDDAD